MMNYSLKRVLEPKVVNFISFRLEWLKHFIPIQKTEQRGTIFISF